MMAFASKSIEVLTAEDAILSDRVIFPNSFKEEFRTAW